MESSKASSDPHRDPIIPNRITGYLEIENICISEEAKVRQYITYVSVDVTRTNI